MDNDRCNRNAEKQSKRAPNVRQKLGERVLGPLLLHFFIQIQINHERDDILGFGLTRLPAIAVLDFARLKIGAITAFDAFAVFLAVDPFKREIGGLDAHYLFVY